MNDACEYTDCRVVGYWLNNWAQLLTQLLGPTQLLGSQNQLLTGSSIIDAIIASIVLLCSSECTPIHERGAGAAILSSACVGAGCLLPCLAAAASSAAVLESDQVGPGETCL